MQLSLEISPSSSLSPSSKLECFSSIHMCAGSVSFCPNSPHQWCLFAPWSSPLAVVATAADSLPSVWGMCKCENEVENSSSRFAAWISAPYACLRRQDSRRWALLQVCLRRTGTFEEASSGATGWVHRPDGRSRSLSDLWIDRGFEQSCRNYETFSATRNEYEWLT